MKNISSSPKLLPAAILSIFFRWRYSLVVKATDNEKPGILIQKCHSLSLFFPVSTVYMMETMSVMMEKELVTKVWDGDIL